MSRRTLPNVGDPSFDRAVKDLAELREGASDALERAFTGSELRAMGLPIEDWAAYELIFSTASAMNLQGTNDPTLTAFENDGAGSRGTYGWAFGAAGLNEMFFDLVLPFSYLEGGDVRPVICWSPSNTNTGGVDWGLEVSWGGKPDIPGRTGRAFPSTTTWTKNSVGSGTADMEQFALFDTAKAPGKKILSTLKCRVYRTGPSGTDTFTGDAYLHWAGLIIPTDRVFGLSWLTKD